MLMQCADGAVHILPALPDVWKSGKVSGLRAWGGFEIEDIEWKDTQLVKLVIKSTLGGNLRLRVPNAVKLVTGGPLKAATGANQNPFYYTADTPQPVISEKASVATLNIKETRLYDIATQKGKTYVFKAEVR